MQYCESPIKQRGPFLATVGLQTITFFKSTIKTFYDFSQKVKLPITISVQTFNTACEGTGRHLKYNYNKNRCFFCYQAAFCGSWW